MIPNDGFVDPVLPGRDKSSLKGVFQTIIPITMIERITFSIFITSRSPYYSRFYEALDAFLSYFCPQT